MENLRSIVNIPESNMTSLLRKNSKIDDKIILSYFRVIERRSMIFPNPFRVWSFDSFFFEAYCQGGFQRVKKWNQGINLFLKDIIFFPIFITNESHWILAVAWPKKQIIHCVDSIGKQRLEIVLKLEEYLMCLANELNVLFNKDVWIVTGSTPAIRQLPGSVECGVYVCWYGDQLATNKPIINITFESNSYRKYIASTLRYCRTLKKTYFKNGECVKRMVMDEDNLNLLPIDQELKNNTKCKSVDMKCNYNGETTTFFSSWDPLLEALNEVIDNDYSNVDSPITFTSIPPPKEIINKTIVKNDTAVQTELILNEALNEVINDDTIPLPNKAIDKTEVAVQTELILNNKDQKYEINSFYNIKGNEMHNFKNQKSKSLITFKKYKKNKPRRFKLFYPDGTFQRINVRHLQQK